jgi:hypothetical protein
MEEETCGTEEEPCGTEEDICGTEEEPCGTEEDICGMAPECSCNHLFCLCKILASKVEAIFGLRSTYFMYIPKNTHINAGSAFSAARSAAGMAEIRSRMRC